MDSDHELLQKWRDGDRQAGSELLARHFNLLRIYFVRRLPERPTEDLIQEVFLRMVEALERFEGRASVRTFLMRIARNVFRETLREIHRPGGQVDPFSESMALITGRTVSSTYAREQYQQLLLDAMEGIAIEQSEQLELYYFHGLKHHEIAEILEIPVGTAKSRMTTARRALLREFMVRLGPDAEAWTEDALDRGLSQVRDVVLSGQPRPTT